MEERKVFGIPNDVGIAAKIIESIPSDWSWLNGVLNAPKDENVEKDTGFYIGRFHDDKATIIGAFDTKPNLVGIMVKKKMPGFIIFEEAGFENGNSATMKTAQKIASAFVKEGYRGKLYFFKGDCDKSKNENPAKCTIVLSKQGSHVSIERNGDYGGKEEYVSPVISTCELLNLEEYALEGSGA